MGERIERIKRAIQPPVTAEWVNMVVTARSEQADKIERSKGPEAADRHREKTGKFVTKMTQRGLI